MSLFHRLGDERGAVRKAQQLARERGGAIAFSRTGDDEWNEYDDPVILGRFGEVPGEFGCSCQGLEGS